MCDLHVPQARNLGGSISGVEGLRLVMMSIAVELQKATYYALHLLWREPKPIRDGCLHVCLNLRVTLWREIHQHDAYVMEKVIETWGFCEDFVGILWVVCWPTNGHERRLENPQLVNSGTRPQPTSSANGVETEQKGSPQVTTYLLHPSHHSRICCRPPSTLSNKKTTKNKSRSQAKKSHDDAR